MKWIVAVALTVLLSIGYFTTGIVIVPRIGALPEGKTVWMWRLRGSPFLETPDSWCIRNDQPNLLCRAVFLGALGKNKAAIIARWPYSETLEVMANRSGY